MFPTLFKFWEHEQPLPLITEESTVENELAMMKAEDAKVTAAWESLRSFFSEKGYTLFQLKGVGSSLPLLDIPSQDAESPEWPYAFWGGDSPYTGKVLLEACLSNKICFAHNPQGRHVAIKRLNVLNSTEEYRINRFLYENQEAAVKNCILPIVEILEHEEQCFAIMPRWGEDPFFPLFGSTGELLHYIHCLLKAINFLHSHLIVHRDLKEDNTLVNHFGAYISSDDNWKRPQLRSAGKLTYALFDFDLALVLTSTLSHGCRLPAHRSFEILSVKLPFDTSQGELDYDPFAFEMGCLGIMLCQHFQHCTPTIPFLAPFLDRLITHKLDKRFTSLQALRLFEEMQAQLTPEHLLLSIPQRTGISYEPWEPGKYDRWRGLPEDFVKQWEHFRAPIPSIYTKTLRHMCLNTWGIRFITAMRLFHRFTAGYVNRALKCIMKLHK